jgi:hypothetical protein
MDKQTVSKLRRDLALALVAGEVNDTLRQLKNIPLADLETLYNAETKGIVDSCGLDEMCQRDLETGLGKLNFYVCGILMHRILEGE